MGYHDLADPAEQLKQGLLGNIDPKIDCKYMALTMYFDLFEKTGLGTMITNPTPGESKTIKSFIRAFDEAIQESSREEVWEIIKVWTDDVLNDLKKNAPSK